MFTALAALEKGTIDLSTRILDSGSLSLDHGEGRIYDSDKHANGYMEARDIVAYSRNVGAARIALGLANTTAKASKILAGTWLRLGFGQKTGVDLAGEAAGPGPRSGAQALEPGRPGQRLVRPGRRRHRAPARRPATPP